MQLVRESSGRKSGLHCVRGALLCSLMPEVFQLLECHGTGELAPGKICRVTADALLATFAWASAEKLNSDSGTGVATSCFLLLLRRLVASRANGFDCEGPACQEALGPDMSL